MNKSDITRDYCMLKGPLAKKGYDWWWHSFTAEHVQTGQKKPFTSNIFCATPLWHSRNRCWSGMIPKSKRPACVLPTAW